MAKDEFKNLGFSEKPEVKKDDGADPTKKGELRW